MLDADLLGLFGLDDGRGVYEGLCGSSAVLGAVSAMSKARTDCRLTSLISSTAK